MSKKIMQQVLAYVKEQQEINLSEGWDCSKEKTLIEAFEAELAKPELPQTDLRKAAELAMVVLHNNLILLKEYDYEEDLHIHHEVLEALRQALAQPERSMVPEFPEPFSEADLGIGPPESWDDGRKKTWTDLQVCQRNKIQLHKYAKHLRELLTQTEYPLDKKADNAREWVSLSELEARNIFKDVDWDDEDWACLTYARAIEAKLKKKNT